MLRCSLLIAPEGIEIRKPKQRLTQKLLLIAPEGIEILPSGDEDDDSDLLIAPEGIEISVLNILCFDCITLNRTRRN